MENCKVISGANENTAQHLLLDAGAFFKNFDVEADTWDEAVTAGKLLGATKGGGSFRAIPTFREIEYDGMRGATKGAKILESWDVAIGVNLVEFTVSNLELSLGISQKEDLILGETEEINNYTKISGRSCVLDTDYVDNITFVGNLSGSDDFVIIQVFNALNTKGLELSFEDKGEAVIETEFIGHFDAKSKEVPFAIYYPKIKAEE